MSVESPDSSQVRTIAAGEFKARCLQLMDEVNETGLTLIVTKRGKPVARIAALSAEERPFKSVLGRTPEIKILGDIVSPLDWPEPHESWEPAGKLPEAKKKRK